MRLPLKALAPHYTPGKPEVMALAEELEAIAIIDEKSAREAGNVVSIPEQAL